MNLASRYQVVCFHFRLLPRILSEECSVPLNTQWQPVSHHKGCHNCPFLLPYSYTTSVQYTSVAYTKEHSLTSVSARHGIWTNLPARSVDERNNHCVGVLCPCQYSADVDTGRDVRRPWKRQYGNSAWNRAESKDTVYPSAYSNHRDLAWRQGEQGCHGNSPGTHSPTFGHVAWL